MGFYIPLTRLSWALTFPWARLEPWAYHFTDLFLHAFNTLLVFWIFVPFLGSFPARSKPIPRKMLLLMAFWGSLFWGLHPLRVESVAWASERKDLLSGFFWLASLRAYFGFARLSRIRDYVASILFFSFSLLCKPVGFTFPLILLLLDLWPFNRFEKIPGPRLLLEKLPFFGISTLMGILTLRVQGSIGGLWGLGTLPFPDRILNASRSILIYLGEQLFPRNLSAFDPLFPKELRDPIHGSCLVLVIGLSWVLWKFRIRFPGLTVAWAIFFLTLLPALGFFQNGNQAAADRFTYLASMGPALLLSFLFFSPHHSWVPIRRTFGLLFLAIMPVLAHFQTGVWKDSVALWEQVLRTHPRNNLVVHYQMGRAYEIAGRNLEALKKYEDADDPTLGFFFSNWGKARVMALQGDLNGSVTNYRRAIYLVPDHPALHSELGLVLQRQGKGKEALQELRRALQLDAHFSEGYHALGTYYRRLDRWEGAMACFETANFLDPDNPTYFRDLMGSYEHTGRSRKALEAYQALKPGSLLALGL
jgi:tetratricopeptide (TPR) repeat protein